MARPGTPAAGAAVIWERRRDPRTARELREAYNLTHARGILRDRPRFYSMVRRKMSLPPNARVLDVGCGGGDFLRAAEAHVAETGAAGDLAPVGLDISDFALREARRVAPRAPLVLGEGERLPFRDRGFDAVVCLGNLEHFLDPRRGVREMARVLKPAGEAWILLPNSYYSGSLWRVIRTGYGPDHHQPIDRFGSINEWRDFLEEGGLRVRGIFPYNRFKWWKRLLPRALAWHFLYRCGV